MSLCLKTRKKKKKNPAGKKTFFRLRQGLETLEISKHDHFSLHICGVQVSGRIIMTQNKESGRDSCCFIIRRDPTATHDTPTS